jgi:hypothetical protein
MIAKLEEFAELYARRPIKANDGGMRSPHLFHFWFAMQHLKPSAVIESGVWKGQGTWFIEQACPDAEIYCIDISWKNLQFRSNRAQYINKDFSLIDWSHLNSDDTLVFFDDHVDSIKRIPVCLKQGFKHIMFEDNYPHSKGDCYSLKEVFSNSGHAALPGIKNRIRRALGLLHDSGVAPNIKDASYVRSVASVYQELPPIFKISTTRWGDPWDDRFPTPAPLLSAVEKPYEQCFLDEAEWYTWICYLGL